MNWRLVAATYVAVLLSAGSAHAQFDSAQISGVVQDSTGAVLPGVDVVLMNVGTKIERQAVTNEAGCTPSRTFRSASIASTRRCPASGRREDRRAGERRRQHPRRHSLEVGRAVRDDLGRGGDDAGRHLGDRPHGARGADRRDTAQRDDARRRWRSSCPATSAATWAALPTAAGTFATGITSINGGRVRGVHDHRRRRPVHPRPRQRRLHDGHAERRHRGGGAGPHHQLPGRARPRLGRAAAAGHQERDAAVPRQRVLEPSGRRAQRQHLDQQPGRHREVAGQVQAVRLHARRSASTSPARSTPTGRSCSSSGARNGSAIRSVGEPARPPCRTAAMRNGDFSELLDPDGVIRDPLHRPAVPGQHHPAEPHQPQRPGAAELLSRSRLRDSSRAPTTGSATRRLRQQAQGQHQDRLRAGRPTIASPCGTRGRRTSGTIPSPPARFRPSGTTRAARWPRLDQHAVVVAHQRVRVLVGFDEPVAVLRAAEL